MQARIDAIVNEAHQQAAAQQQPAKPQVQGSLMDHTIALRREVAQLSQQVQAQGQVTEAVGQAVGQLYQLFCQQTKVTDPSPTYSTQFQQQEPPDF